MCRWKNIPGCINLLFFAQLVDELLFDYSIPSNRISTLNCHYLCLDALNAIDAIDYNGVPEGTLKPIMEELLTEINKDPAFTDSIHPSSFFMKMGDGFPRTTKRVADLNYDDLKRTAAALKKVFFDKDLYYESLKKKIIEIVERNDPAEQQNLFRMTKSMLTELMNKGYSLKYLFFVMHKVFWSPRSVINSPNVILEFFDAFKMESYDYDVIFKVKKNKAHKLIRYIEELKLEDSVDIETEDNTAKKFFDKKNHESFLRIKRKAIDPYRAYEKAKELLEDNMAVYRLYDHEYQYKIGLAPYGVFDMNGKFYRGGSTKKPVQHTKMPSDKSISEGMELANNAIDNVADGFEYSDFYSLLSAIMFHSHSLDSYSEENQLLDLWAIFETIMNISNKHTTDRIQQVCIVLVPLLKRKYLYSLFDQLADDIKNYSSIMFADIIGGKTERKEIVQQICAYTLLPEYESKRNSDLAHMATFPLLRERIEYYYSKLHTRHDAFLFVEKHAERVKWQIMRIYRNRNLIIHNGESMPYLSLLIENLHSYVDDFIAYAIHSIAKGNNIESMCQEVFVTECKWNDKFSKSKELVSLEDIREMLSV